MKGKIKLLTVVVASFLVQGCAAHKTTVRDSFVQVLKTVDISACGANPKNSGEAKCAVFVQLSGVGSGAIVWNERSVGGAPRTLVMTADHVCHDRNKFSQEMVPQPVLENFKRENEISGNLTFMISKIDIKLRDSRGVTFNTKGKPWLRNVEADICILESSINRKAIPVSKSRPEYGERVVNISAPYGLMFTSPEGGAVYNTEGHYSGRFTMQEGVRDMYTIWTAPGSSGSPLLNERGEIIGVVSAISMITWPRVAPRGMVAVTSAPSNITFGPTLEQVRFSVNEAIAAMRRGRPFLHDPKSTSSLNTEEVEQTTTPDTDSDQFLFPYIYEWR